MGAKPKDSVSTDLPLAGVNAGDWIVRSMPPGITKLRVQRVTSRSIWFFRDVSCDLNGQMTRGIWPGVGPWRKPTADELAAYLAKDQETHLACERRQTERVARNRLHAAAPALLEACKWAEALMRRDGYDVDGEGKWILCEMRAAIKAAGEEESE